MPLPRPASGCSPRPGSTSARDPTSRSACARSPPTRASPNRRFYARFHSKDELLTAAYRWWGMREMERRDAAPVGRFPDAVANVFDHYEAHGTAILRMLSQEDRIPAIRNLTDKGRAYHRDWANRVFAATPRRPAARGQRAPAHSPRDRDRRAGVEATATRHAAQPPPSDKDRPGDDRVLLAAIELRDRPSPTPHSASSADGCCRRMHSPNGRGKRAVGGRFRHRTADRADGPDGADPTVTRPPTELGRGTSRRSPFASSTRGRTSDHRSCAQSRTRASDGGHRPRSGSALRSADRPLVRRGR